MTEKLKLCPFCGGEARIQVTDDEGNLKSESYLEDPYSGVGYVIIHDISNSTDSCPIATNLDEIQGCYIYTSKQEAIDAWNKRVNGCPSSYDCGALDKNKEKECILCKFHCISAKDELFNKEYEKKSKECWKEYFLTGKSKW